MMSDPALIDAMDKADSDDWEALEAFYQQTHYPHDDRARNNTCVFVRFDRTGEQVTEYHRNLGRLAHWSRTIRPAFSDQEAE